MQDDESPKSDVSDGQVTQFTLDYLLTPEQRAREVALNTARAALGSTSTSPFGTSDTLPKYIGSGGLVYVADWILNGSSAWEDDASVESEAVLSPSVRSYIEEVGRQADAAVPFPIRDTPQA